MAFFPPVLLIRRKHIVKKLKDCGAVSSENAKTFSEANIINPNGFSRLTEMLVKRGIILKTEEGRFYVAK